MYGRIIDVGFVMLCGIFLGMRLSVGIVRIEKVLLDIFLESDFGYARFRGLLIFIIAFGDWCRCN